MSASGTAHSARSGGRVTSHLGIACPEGREECTSSQGAQGSRYATQQGVHRNELTSSKELLCSRYSCGNHAVSSCLLAVLMQRAATSSRFSILSRHHPFRPGIVPKSLARRDAACA